MGRGLPRGSEDQPHAGDGASKYLYFSPTGGRTHRNTGEQEGTLWHLIQIGTLGGNSRLTIYID